MTGDELCEINPSIGQANRDYLVEMGFVDHAMPLVWAYLKRGDGNNNIMFYCTV